MPTITQHEPEQLSLFMNDGITAVYPEKVATGKIIIPVPVMAKTVTPPAEKKETDSKKMLTDVLAEPTFKDLHRRLTDATGRQDFRALLKCLGIETFHFGKEKTIWCNGKNIHTHYRMVGEKECLETQDNGNWENNFPVLSEEKTKEGYEYIHKLTINVAYVSTETAETIITPVNVKLVEEYNQSYLALVRLQEMKLCKTQFPSKIVDNVFFAQTEGEMSQILSKHKPWIVRWLSENTRYKMEKYLAAPWLETLVKAGYTAIANRFLYPEDFHVSPKKTEQFNRLCGPGTKPKSIFKCPKSIYEVLKDEKNLDIWDTIRRLEKKGAITDDAVLMIYQMGLQPKELELVNSILGQKHNGRPVFSITSLVNYINRLDMYEAIPSGQAFVLLNDYLHMCHQLGMPPRVDGDSLKREHDIAARLCRQRRDQIMEQKMKERAEQEKKEIEEGNKKLSRATYYEKIFFVRPITEYNDLLDEAIQQDNCVASYAGRIAEGKSRIFTLRETAHPEKSLVTIELSPDCKTIRQKYLARNQVIRNKAINDFIDRWHRQLNAA